VAGRCNFFFFFFFFLTTELAERGWQNPFTRGLPLVSNSTRKPHIS